MIGSLLGVAEEAEILVKETREENALAWSSKLVRGLVVVSDGLGVLALASVLIPKPVCPE